MIYKNSEVSSAIDEYIHSAWQRQALKLRLCDGLTYEQIAEITGYSTQYIKEIVKRHKQTIFDHQ